MVQKLFKNFNIILLNYKEFCLYFVFLTFLFSKFHFQINGIKIAPWEISTLFLVSSIFFEKKIILNRVNIFIVLLFFSYLLSFVINFNFVSNFNVKELTLLIQIMRCLIIFFIIYNFYDEVNLEKVLKNIIYIITAYLIFCYSLHLYFSEFIGVQDKLDIINKFGRKSRLQGFGLGPNYLAWILVFSLFYCLFYNKKIHFCFILFALYLTGSRTLLFISILYIIVFLLLKLKINHIKYFSVILTIILFLIWDNHFYLLFKTPRWEIYIFVWQLLNESSFLNIIFGHGPRALYYNLINSESIFNKYSHNSYIDVFFDFGILFISICFFGVFQILKIVYGLFKNSTYDLTKNLSKSLSFFIITYLIAMIFFSYFYFPIFWFFLALFILLDKKNNNKLHLQITTFNKTDIK